MSKKHNKICKYCKNHFEASNKRQLFCSISCSDKNRYYNKPNRKERVKKIRDERNKGIHKCELCGITYDKIKTIKELGSEMYNGQSVFHKDHIIPRSKNGDDTIENTRYLCWFCNFSRKDIDQKYDEAIKQASIAFWRVIGQIT